MKFNPDLTLSKSLNERSNPFSHTPYIFDKLTPRLRPNAFYDVKILDQKTLQVFSNRVRLDYVQSVIF